MPQPRRLGSSLSRNPWWTVRAFSWDAFLSIIFFVGGGGMVFVGKPHLFLFLSFGVPSPSLRQTIYSKEGSSGLGTAYADLLGTLFPCLNCKLHPKSRAWKGCSRVKGRTSPPFKTMPRAILGKGWKEHNVGISRFQGDLF